MKEGLTKVNETGYLVEENASYYRYVQSSGGNYGYQVIWFSF